MKRIVFLLVSLVTIGSFRTESSYASSNGDAATCHHGLDGDRGKVASISDPAKKADAAGHLKAAYGDELAGKYTDCLSELKAAEALMP
jgi:hypothetical protein